MLISMFINDVPPWYVDTYVNMWITLKPFVFVDFTRVRFSLHIDFTYNQINKLFYPQIINIMCIS